MTGPMNNIGFAPDKAQAEAARRWDALMLASVALGIATAIVCAALAGALAS